MKFSERLGITPPKIELLTNSIDKELRIKIWNIIFILFIDNMEYHLRKESQFYTFFKIMWHTFFKLPLDNIPGTRPELEKFLKDQIMLYQWYDIYNLLEYMVQNLSFRKEEFVELINKVLEEELSGFRIIGIVIAKITDEKEITEIKEAITKSKENKLIAVSNHLESALTKFSDKKNPDYRNSIKESISAVESISKIIAGKPQAELGEALNIIEKSIGMHGALKKGFLAIYGYTSDAGGIRHAMINELNSVNLEDAKFMLISCSAFINYMIIKADKSGIKFN